MISIRARLAWSLLLGSALTFGLGGWWLERHVHDSIESQHDSMLVSRAWALANALQSDDGRIEVESLYGITAGLQAGAHPLFFEVWHGDGSIAGRSPTLGEEHLPRLAPVGDEAVLIDLPLPPDGRRGRAAGVLVGLHDENGPDEWMESTLDDLRLRSLDRRPIDRLTIVVAESVEALDKAIVELRHTVLAFAVFSFLFSVLYVGWSLARGLKPLTELAERARKLEPGSLQAGVGTDVLPSEIAPLRDRLNELLSRVRLALEHEQRFTAAMTHELRTPIAELRLMIEVALRREASEAERRFLEDALAVSCRMQRLVESLLALRRAETASLPVEADEVDLRGMLEELTEESSSYARRRVPCVLEVEDGIRVRTNEGLLRSIAGNLIGNALEYSPEASEVRVRATADRGAVELEISNPAPELAPQDVERLFEPFWRKDGGGSSSAHAGIGLTLTRALARALELDLQAELAPDGRLSMRLTGLLRTSS